MFYVLACVIGSFHDISAIPAHLNISNNHYMRFMLNSEWFPLMKKEVNMNLRSKRKHTNVYEKTGYWLTQIHVSSSFNFGRKRVAPLQSKRIFPESNFLNQCLHDVCECRYLTRVWSDALRLRNSENLGKLGIHRRRKPRFHSPSRFQFEAMRARPHFSRCI